MLPDKKIVYILMVFQVLILTGMIASSWYPTFVGKEIRMKVLPLDPRDLLRGNYVRLNYDFNNVYLDSTANHLDTTHYYNFGEVMYVELTPKGDYYEMTSLWDKLPQNTDKVYLKASVNDYSPNYYITLSAGIESYYTQSDKALQIEKDLRSKQVYAVIKIAPNGQARLVGLDLAQNRKK